jgi:hypothetical protein
MTRRGSLIYYLTAWICGCFFMSLAIWIRDMWGAAIVGAQLRQAFGLLFFYFYGLIFGAFAAVLGAFFLRRVGAGLKCKTPLHWAILGAIISPALIGLLGTWGRHLSTGDPPGLRLDAFFLFGPKTALEAGWWLAIPAGAATAYLLCRVQRAFTQPAVPAPPASA